MFQVKKCCNYKGRDLSCLFVPYFSKTAINIPNTYLYSTSLMIPLGQIAGSRTDPVQTLPRLVNNNGHFHQCYIQVLISPFSHKRTSNHFFKIFGVLTSENCTSLLLYMTVSGTEHFFHVYYSLAFLISSVNCWLIHFDHCLRSS